MFVRVKTWMLLVGLWIMTQPETVMAELQNIDHEILAISISKAFFEDATGEDLKELKSEWQEVCGKIAKAMTAGGGPFGMGFFSSHQCVLGHLPKPKQKQRWILEINAKKDNKLVIEFFQNFDKKLPLRSPIVMKLARISSTLMVLKDDGFRNYLILSLLDVLPATYKLIEKPASNEITFEDKNQIPYDKTQDLIADDLIFYQLWYRDDLELWASVVVGQGRLATDKKVKKKLSQITYKIQFDDRKIKPELPIWAHNANGVGKVDMVVQKDLAALASKTEQDNLGIFAKAAIAMGDSFSGGYFGFRYGLPMDKSKPLVRKTEIMSALLEVRGGPLQGLRLYYDQVPQVKDAALGLNYQYHWNRAVFGWSFGRPLLFLDRIDLVPKVGVWNFRAKIDYIGDEGEIKTAPFHIKNGLAFGAEVGGEIKVSSIGLIRAWASGDMSPSGSTSEKININTMRYGMDAFLNGPRIGESLNLAFLGFGYFESVTFKKEMTKDGELGGFQFAQNYLGLGLSVSW